MEDELWDKLVESFEIAAYQEVNNENVERKSQTPMQKTPSRRAPRDTYVHRNSPRRKIN
jgi:hypothetical protein